MNNSERHSAGLSTDITIYFCLLAISGLQIFLAYHSGGSGLFVRLLLVAVVQAALAVLFFMHLRAERRSLVVFVTVFTVFVLTTMNMIWSDSFRLLTFRLLK